MCIRDRDRYVDDADRVICGPMDADPGVRLAFVEKDGAVIELYAVSYTHLRRGIVDGHVGQHLAVQLHACLLEAVHEHRVACLLYTSRCV